ncbi:hypothetical protein PFICI_12533 [Pestalotiopsis fici W106-1]|uniref:Uncharacterized protein n=1 Tax=Pestalotiopsis fici (strain W106-1 / CGMCC3.15140) TaxID=1229662 RepID=W3WP60_PESFW|nr:uncharacterized protein PFICI_12533 [Pestalotiopsis fici W106-1]ETS75589.1 hypothetical protein PFICI_12533 [Pestalotiopsis fici W106-1]
MSIQDDAFAKSFYSFIMSDLGQNMSTLASDPEVLQLYTKDFQPNHSYGTLSWDYAKSSFDNLTSHGMSRELGVRPSTFYVQYICQVPELKSTGSLIVAIILADLVFLTTAWSALKLITTWRLERKDKAAMYCAGCVRSFARNGYELQSLATPNKKSQTRLPQESHTTFDTSSLRNRVRGQFQSVMNGESEGVRSVSW